MLRYLKGDVFKHLVDSGARGALEQASEEGSLPGGGLSQTGLTNAAHVHLLDGLLGHASPLHRRLDGLGAQLCGGQLGQGAVEGAHGGAGSRHDQHLI